MKQIKKDKAGYTILVMGKYILCGTCRNCYFKDINKLGVSNPRQYKSVKILLNNLFYHFEGGIFPELDNELLNNNYVTKAQWTQKINPAYSQDAIKYLIKQGLIQIVKVSQILTVEEV